MEKSFTFFPVAVRSQWLALCLALLLNICSCYAECLSKDANLNCFSKNLLYLADSCESSQSASNAAMCWSILSNGTNSPESGEWIAAQLAGAWYRVQFPKAFRMTKVMIEQRSWKNSQIKEIVIKFDDGPGVQMTLTQNINGTADALDAKKFASRSSSTVTFTVLSMYTDNGLMNSDGYLLPGFKKIQIYDENCDRDYQELNMEHRSLSTDQSVVRSWSPFTGSLKMFLTFHETLSLYFAYGPSVLTSYSYKFVIDTRRKELAVFKIFNKEVTQMKNESFSQQYHENKMLLFINRNATHWEIGHRAGVVKTVEDTTLLKMRVWGVACSSLKPVKLTFWKHIGKCFEKADYFWLADKLIGGTTIAELRRGKDGHIRDANEVQALPFGPFIDGHTSSSLYLSGAYSGGLRLAKFHDGCLSDITTCTAGYTIAFWMLSLDADPANAWKQILWLSNFGFSLNYKLSECEIAIRVAGKEYTATLHLERTVWKHVFVFWDPVKGLEALVNNKKSISGTTSLRKSPSRTGFTSLQVGQKTGVPTRCARMAIRELALWERRISLEEARAYYHCNNFETPLKFLANYRHPSTKAGSFPFPGQNIALPKYGGSCTSNAHSDGPCQRVIDGKDTIQSYRSDSTMTIVLTFDRVYVVNKVLFHGYKDERKLTIKFADGEAKLFKLTDPKYSQEVQFEDKATDSLEISVVASTSLTRVTEISVYYDFSTNYLPSRYVNLAYGCRVKDESSTLLTPFITDGLTSDHNMTVVDLNETPSSNFFQISSTKFIRIDLHRIVVFNLLRLWLVHDASMYDHLRTLKFKSSYGNEIEYLSTLPASGSGKTYMREFVSERIRTEWLHLYLIDTHEMTKRTFGIKEVEVFFDVSKDLQASKTIIDENSVHTWEKGLSSAKLGTFDFLLNIDVNITQNSVKFLGRATYQNDYRTIMRVMADSTVYIRAGINEISSYAVVADGTWHNIKLFYNAWESRLSLFIDNRLESTIIALVPEEPDGWDWETGATIDSGFLGSLKNFRIHQAVRGIGMQSGDIPDSALSVTSASSNITGANMARLFGEGAWVIAPEDNDQNQYLQVDLGISCHIMYVAFQGKDDMWVTWARIEYSMDGVQWKFFLDINEEPQKFRASHDANSVAMVMLYSPVVARYIRVYPYLGNVAMALKTEIYDHDYGLPFNSWLFRHVPSYEGCIEREELFKLQTFFPSSFKSLASTPEDCQMACALENYKLAGLFQGSVCYCTKSALTFSKLSDDQCSFSCPGNPVLRCGGETTVSLYETSSKPRLCTDCTVGIFSDPLNEMFSEIKIFAKSSGDAVSYIDVSLNGVHIANLSTATGEMLYQFLEGGDLYLVAEARDSEGRQVAVATRRLTVQHKVMHTSIVSPNWVLRGETYWNYITVERGNDVKINCSIAGEYFPLEVDDNMLVKTGDIIPEYPLPVVDDDLSSSIVLPAQSPAVGGAVVGFEFTSTGPGSLTIKIFRPKCDVGMVYCTTTLNCMLQTKMRHGCSRCNPPTTAHTFPSTERICDTLDPYCPTRKLTLNLTANYIVYWEGYFEFSKAGVHYFNSPVDGLFFESGDMLGYSGASGLQYKSSGVSFRMESTQSGLYSRVERIQGRTALLRAHYWAKRSLQFELSKAGKLNCSLGNDVTPDITLLHHVKIYEEIADVSLIFRNISATDESVFFVVLPHPGGDVSYNFEFGENKTVFLENKNSSHILNVSYTFTKSGYYPVKLTIENVKSKFRITSGIHILDPIEDLAWPSSLYAPVNRLANLSFIAKSGENVTVTVHFGDGAFVTSGLFDFGTGNERSVSHIYAIPGSYNTSLFAKNAVSNATLKGLVIALDEVCDVTVTVATKLPSTSFPVVFLARVAKGTDVQYLVSFNCSETGTTLPEQLFVGDKLLMNFTEPCLYDFNVLAYNNVSAEIYNGSLLVEGMTIVNLRATVGLVIASEPTTLTAEVDSGLVVNCTWDFGDGTKKTLPFGPGVQHIYGIGGNHLLKLNCSNPVNSANVSLDVKVLVYITQLDITTLQEENIAGYGRGQNMFSLQYPVLFQFTTNCQFVDFTVNFGDSSLPIVTNETSIEHVFPPVFASYDVTVNVSNAISSKVTSVTLSLLQPVKDVAIETNGPVELGEEMIFEVTVGEMGTYPCYYFNLGDGTELIYKGFNLANCPTEYNYVTDIRFITSTSGISFTHVYANLTVYDVTCVGLNPVSSEIVKTEAVIVPIPCTTPIVDIEGLAQNVDDAREYVRSEEFELITKNSIDCEASSETDFQWKVFKMTSKDFSEDGSVEILLPDVKTDDWKIVFKSRSFEYGLYYIRFTLTMVGVKGVSSSAFGYIKIVPSPIVAGVHGGSVRVVGFNKMILLDGGLSRDPDVEEGDYEDMYFYWYCKRSDDNYTFPFEPEDITQPQPVVLTNTTNSTQFVDHGGCFGQGPGRLNHSDTTMAIDIDTGLMRENASYTLQLLVKKDFRRSVFNLFMEIIPGNPPTVALSCLRNCLEKFNPSVRVSLEVTCQDCRNSDGMNYRWEVYLFTEDSWAMLDNLDDIVLTRHSSPGFVIKENSLLGNRTYKIRVEVSRPGGIPGIAELVRTVNIPPFGGWCLASPETGYALDTLYGVTCGDWMDDNLPLKYTFSYSPGSGFLESLVYVGGNSFSPNVTFPTGQEENNTLIFVVLVTDSLDASALVQLKVQVNPTNPDAFKSQVDDLTSANGTFSTLLSSGDTQRAFQMISAVGNMLNFESEKDRTRESTVNGTGTSPNGTNDWNAEDKKQKAKNENTRLRTGLVNMISTATIETLDDALRTSSVLGTVTKETGEISAEAQDPATSTLETVGEVLKNAAEKPGTHPRIVAKTAEAALFGLGNVIHAAFHVEEPVVPQQPKINETESESSDTSQKSENAATEAPPADMEVENDKILQEKQRKRELGNKLMLIVKTVAKAVTTNKAPGEQPTRFDTPHLSLEVYRESPSELDLKVLNAGAGSFALPRMGALLNDSGIVDIATVATPTNPFEDEGNRVHSVVMTTNVRNASGGISVSNLSDPIDIRLPRDSEPVPSQHLYQAAAGKMIFHKFEVKSNDSSISVDLHLVGNCSERANFSLFLQKNRKPSVHENMFNITLPDPKVKEVYNGSQSRNTFFASNVDLKRDAAGTFYVGVMYNRPGIECPDVMNYTADFFTSGCLYFDEERNIWKGDGCTVGVLTNMNVTQCLCNHLTSFGGDFVVPPNSIDWDAVGAGFTNLSENPVVFAVVMSIVGVYFILLVWVRRLDKKDLEEFVTIPLPDNDPRDNYNYEVVVYTGYPKNSGTTAKVFIILSGSRDETEPRALLDSTNTALKPGGVDTFILSVPSSLGKLDHVRVWHDNSGDSASWYLNRILVRDVQTDRKTWFLCDQWLAVEEGDGLIERTLPAATKDDLVSFNFLFSIEARRKLFDEHLWFSVLSRRPRSQFTRAQRLSCCLAILLSTMLANAMFYQTGDSSASNNEIRAGPLVFSLQQIWIGFISCLVILPANLLIVYIFRNVRPKEGPNDEDKNSDNAQKYAINEGNEAELLSDPTENLVSCSKTSLPQKFIYVAYILLFVTISVSATFTIFYGFTFGKEKSEKWISSTLLSFIQDLMLLQPLKVFAAATFIALIIKDPNKVDQGDKSDNKPEMVEQAGDRQADDEDRSISGDDTFREATTPRSVVKPIPQSDLVAARELRTKQKIMRRIISEVCWYISYLVLISIVAYGNRDPKAYLVTKTMNDMFAENKYTARLRLEDVSSIPQYWSWLHNSILPAINPPYWYGPYGLDDIETISKTMASKSRARAKSKVSKTKSSGSSGSDDLDVVYHSYPKGYTADRGVSYIVGSARARQLRNSPQERCTVHPSVRHLSRHCSKEYSWSNEDEGCYNVSWSSYNGSAHKCQQMRGGKSPWAYHTAWDLKGTPFWGKFHNYWGGGYVWNLDTSLSVIQKESKTLMEQSWVDKDTRAVFFEFTIYNAFTNFFCSVTLLIEKQITGGIYPYGQLHTLRLYHYVGAKAIVTLVCEIIFVGVLCHIFARELKEARNIGIKNYFRDPWNYFDILGLVFSFTAIGLYFARMAATSLALRRINEEHGSFVSFHYVSAIDQSFTILLGLAVFVYFLKVLRLLRFNRKISLLSTTLIACAETLLGFLLTYMVLFAAYAQLMYLVYGRDLPEHSSYQRCLSSLMEMTLGSSDFDGMNATNRFLTGFIFFSYTMLNTCVCMNLFVSILSETFSEVRADVLLQPNDHEIVDFIVKSVKKNFFRAVEPVTNPIYKESKDDIELSVDKITQTSECIQGALQGLCKEDIRQTLWFRDRTKLSEKRVLFDILLDCEENWTENDIGNAVPLLDGILKKFTMQDLLRFRDDQRRKIASELAKSLSSRSRRARFSSPGSYAISDSGEDVEENGSWNDDEGSGEDDRCWSRVGDFGGDSDVDSDGYVNSGDGDDERGYDSNCSYDHREDDYGDDNSYGDDGDDGDEGNDSSCSYNHRDDGGGGSDSGDIRGDYDGDDRHSHGDSDEYEDGYGYKSDGVDGDENDRPPSNCTRHESCSDSYGSDNSAHSEHEDKSGFNQSIDQHDSDANNGYNHPRNSETLGSPTLLSPRSNACVISMETDKQK